MKKRIFLALVVATAALYFVGCAGGGTNGGTPSSSTSSTTTTIAQAFSIASSAFADNAAIPTIYADTSISGGQNRSIPLAWANAPASTESFALSMRDIDASDFNHWEVVNLTLPHTYSIADGISASGMPAGSTQYYNDYGTPGYGGPAPPSGTHRYVITLYALSCTVEALSGVVSYADFLSSLSGKIIAQASITGTFTAP